MFCIQASVPITAIAASEGISTRRPCSSAPEKVTTISAIAAKAKTSTSM